MIDQLSAVYDQRRPFQEVGEYTPSQAIESQTITDNGAETMTVVFGPCHGSDRFDGWVRDKLVDEGSDVTHYNFNDQVLNPDPNSVRESFHYAAEQIAEFINNPLLHIAYKRVNLLGFSLGNLPLSMAASRLQNFGSVTMVVPGSNLAEPFMNGIRTRRLSNEYRERDNQTRWLKDECWTELAPSAHAAAFRGHPMHVVLALRDKFIAYEYGKQFVNDLREAGNNPAVDISRTGHIATAALYSRGRFRKQPRV